MKRIRLITFSIFGATLIGGHVFIAYSSYEYFLRIMPKWEAIIPIKNDSKAEGTTQYKKIRQIYGRYLVDDNKNESWWNWSYRQRPKIKKEETSKFKNVKMGWSRTDTNALNQICKEIYDKEKLNDQEKKDIWRYCSIGRIELITLDKVNNYKNISNYEKKRLVSTEHRTNNWWWTIRAMEFGYDTTDEILENCEEFYDEYSKLHVLSYICGLPV